jgi:hypothetical protein
VRQLHHIDEDPSNNDPQNLLPLCPNCHLIDQHNPTRLIEPALLSLFRRYKDPYILCPQFTPIFRRLRFLDSIDDSDSDLEELGRKAQELGRRANDLIRFTASLEMGTYFSDEIAQLIHWEDPGAPSSARYVAAAPGGLSPTDPEKIRAFRRNQNQTYLRELDAAREKVYDLAIESLRFQRWPLPGSGSR